MARFQTTVGAFDAQLGNYDTIKDTALTPVAWTVLIGGVVMALFGAFGALLIKQETAIHTPARTSQELTTACR